MEIEAFWLEEEDEETGDDVSSYVWECPSCEELNSVGDDFVWNGETGRHQAKDTYCCEHCESDDEHVLYRK